MTCICVLTAFRPSFPHLETLKKILENSTLSRYVKKKKKKSRPTDPIFKFWSGEGNITFFFFWSNIGRPLTPTFSFSWMWISETCTQIFMYSIFLVVHVCMWSKLLMWIYAQMFQVCLLCSLSYIFSTQGQIQDFQIEGVQNMCIQRIFRPPSVKYFTAQVQGPLNMCRP